MNKLISNIRVNNLLDKLGFSASFLCAIHCALLPLLVSFSSFMSLGFLENPAIETGMFILSFALASVSLLLNYFNHHKKPGAIILMTLGFLLIITGKTIGEGAWEAVFSSFGAFCVAFAHFMNYRLCKNHCKI